MKVPLVQPKDFKYKVSESEDFITFSIVLVENIPDDLSLHLDGRSHLPLSVGFHSLLDQAKHSIEVVSPVWELNSWDLDTIPNAAQQVQFTAESSAEHKPTAFPLCSVRAMQLFCSKSVCRLLMRLVLLRYVLPF